MNSLKAQFSGTFAPANWSAVHNNSNGSINTSSAPTSITIVGTDNQSLGGGDIRYEITAPNDGIVSFNWTYSSLDDGPQYDPAYYTLAGASSVIVNSGAKSQSGIKSFNVSAGQKFGFKVSSHDNISGAATLTISNFKFTSVNTISTSFNSNKICLNNNSVSVGYTIDGTFEAGNTFSAQLSDASGSFANPEVIGSVSATSSGTINATIPASSTPGTAYRIRVVSSNPVLQGTNNGTDITINSSPVAQITGSSTICTGAALNLDATVVEGATYSWSGPNGYTAATQDISIANAQSSNAGTYSLTVTNSNGCSATTTTNVVVNALPTTPVISANGATTFCAGGAVTLSTAAATSYQWYKNGTAINTATSQNYIATESGNYTVEVSNANGCKSTSAATTVTVNPLVTPSVSIGASTATTILMNTSVTFTATPVNGGTPAYQWKKNGVNIPTATAATYTTNTLANNDKITCEMTSTATCATPATVTSNELTITVLTPTVATTGTVNNFTQIIGSVSAVQTFNVSGSNLIGDVIITAPTGYEVSKNGTTWAGTLTLTPVSNTVTATAISIRLNAATANTYTGNVTITSNSAIAKNIAVNGTAILPALTVTGTPTNFFQIIGSVSATQTFSVGGANLLNNTVVTAPAGYQVSLNGTTWNSSVTLTPVNNTLAPTTVSVRLNGATAGTYPGTIAITSTGAVAKSLTVNGTAVLPTVTVTGTPANFFQIVGSVSATQTITVSGTNLLANETITAPAGYELSTNGTTWSNVVTLTPVSNTVAATTVSIRLNAATVGAYTGNISIASTGAAAQSVAVSGIAVQPAVSASGTPANFTQVIGYKSTAQTITVGGTNLLGNITVTAPAGYELSLNGSSWNSSVSLSPTNNTVAATTVSVRLGATTAGNYAGNISISSTGAAAASIAVSGVALPTPVLTIDASALAFTQNFGTPSVTKSYQISGNNLLDNVILTAPIGFEISLNGSVWYKGGKPLVLPQQAGKLANTTIYVRLNSDEAKNYSGVIANTTQWATIVNLPVSGTNFMTLKVGPNPVPAGTNQITVWHPQYYTVAVITVYNMSGVKMATYNSKPLSISTQINLQQLPAGAYLIEFNRLNVKQVFKFVKQ